MSLIKSYSNEDLAVEAGRKSRMLRRDRQTVFNEAFVYPASKGEDNYYARLLRKCIYQMNLDEQIISDFAASANMLLCELELMKEKTVRQKEAEEHLRACANLRWAMHSPGNEEMLHDEATGGWHHPYYPDIKEW